MSSHSSSLPKIACLSHCTHGLMKPTTYVTMNVYKKVFFFTSCYRCRDEQEYTFQMDGAMCAWYLLHSNPCNYIPAIAFLVKIAVCSQSTHGFSHLLHQQIFSGQIVLKWHRLSFYITCQLLHPLQHQQWTESSTLEIFFFLKSKTIMSSMHNGTTLTLFYISFEMKYNL